ncbi:ElaB/YqjD/DUF883 family membrane-anchored ribosome-binding protein [Sulfitobacter undariae]|uniref:ElaB/YqjD/DUF883 family membrane-anchored ribosome-binding protein n=1 Tax=Sulfitobacter undariae TaxID=1563671 RepID=A0A7W6H0A1_9RHOB|nr:DUF883 family protein [Sulfitobacter undariae]MBB3992449.1 ElaB/YqjD/DUF883 family membrane-anchored ribosome-binding protein [Sulfitobacter undariae]
MANASNGKNVSVEDLSAQMEILRNDLSNLTQTLSDYGVSKSAEATRYAKATAADLEAAGRKKASEAQAQAEEFVHNQPATSLGIAAGIGFLVGMMTARR